MAWTPTRVQSPPVETILREKLEKCLASQINHGSEEDSGRAPDIGDSQANRVACITSAMSTKELVS
jgi:hypothetical protein